jgi:hypothetical protein
MQKQKDGQLRGMDMARKSRRLERERRTMEKMVGIYCAGHHDVTGTALCPDCRAFLRYAETRLQKCPYGPLKPTCSNCPVHCYKPAQRQAAKAIMRYAGPRMLLKHPLLALAHQLDGFRKAAHPRQFTRAERLGQRDP